MTVLLKRQFLFLAMSLLAFMSNSVSAQTCPAVSTDTTITSSCTTATQADNSIAINWTGGNLNIGSSTSGSVIVTNDTYAGFGVYISGNLVGGMLTNTVNGYIVAAGLQGIGITNFSGTNLTLNNLGSIHSSLRGADGITNGGTGSINILNNSGVIGGADEFVVGISNSTSINTLINSGTITGTSDAIYNGGTITTLSNLSTGIINGGVKNLSSIGALINSGIINGGSQSSISNTYGSSIGTITNTGSMYTGNGSADISNTTTVLGQPRSGTIGTLNNSQGAGNANGALTYYGKFPSNYIIIINSPTSFGQLAVTSGTSTTNFGIYTGSAVRNGTYTSVLSGIGSSNLSALSGTYGSANWALTPEATCTTNCIYDLIISGIYTGPSVANTNQSLVNTASALQGTYTLQNSVLANSFSYDCTVFGANDVCVSAGGRNTQVQAANGLNNTSALLIAAYRPHPNYRIGAYADQNLSASNPGGTVNLGNNTPLIGLFGAWNERLDGTGTEVKVSAAYGQKNTTINRSVVGSGATASEAGTGSSTLNSQGAQVTAKYGFSIMDNVIVSPYVGVRYTQNNMGGYTEGTSSSVTAPLTYSALNTNATTALAGVGASYRVIPTVMTFASAGVETDTNTANGTYTATNASIGALTPVNFNANPVKTRPTATVGAYYDIEKNQRLGITGIYRQEAYQAVSTTTVIATYTIGL
ncbi:autotransporter outer membrane beta-barrel domain-containing protein [Polynucleobacter paneuropaeus]|nr:autotransporter outer membrane beta-barrel domain-containing protein [Polynucleobacter paneuropaeus]MBT8600387.1 autotransporter outer membrane beta-barrel domain-containing protein [Polynucleobacter paneuropaeus]